MKRPCGPRKIAGATVIKVPLADPKGAATHDIKAMLAAASTPGVIYICNPNNPTGTCTPRSDIEYAVANAPKGSILLIDEAYIHLCDAPRSLDFVKEGKNVIVLRTFSKLYGMAGIRMGFAIGRPDLLKQISMHGGFNALPITALAAAKTSLLEARPGRRAQEDHRRCPHGHLAWLKSEGHAHALREQLLHARNRPPRQGSAGRHGSQRHLHRPHLAGMAHPGAHHRGHPRRDARLPQAFKEVMASKAPRPWPPARIQRSAAPQVQCQDCPGTVQSSTQSRRLLQLSGKPTGA
jgi:hypothetical protein